MRPSKTIDSPQHPGIAFSLTETTGPGTLRTAQIEICTRPQLADSWNGGTVNEHPRCRPNPDPTPNEPPPLGRPPVFDIQSQATLSSDTLEEFILWAAAVPIAHVDLIRQRIARCHGDDRLVDVLLDALWRLPVMDVGRHRIILSILGELKHEKALKRLEEFVWFQGELTPPPPHSEPRKACMFEPFGTEILQSRAAEMLSYLGTAAASEATIKVARDHPKIVVRAAAIDAHLFNHGDSRETADQLRKIVRASDRHLVGLPRKVRDGDLEQFERSVFEWYEANPEHRPPKPRQDLDFPPQPRSWFQTQKSHRGEGEV